MRNNIIEFETEYQKLNIWKNLGFDLGPIKLEKTTQNNNDSPKLNSKEEVEEMGNTKKKLLYHLNWHRREHIDSFKKRDPLYKNEELIVSDLGDFSRSIDQLRKECYHHSDVINPNRNVYRKAIAGFDMKEYGRLTEDKWRTLSISSIRKLLSNNKILIEAEPFQGNSSSVSKEPRTSLVYVIIDKFGLITHTWECRISIPYNEWNGTEEKNTRRTGFQLLPHHFTSPKYAFQQIIGGIEPYMPKKIGGGYIKAPGVICMPI